MDPMRPRTCAKIYRPARENGTRDKYCGSIDRVHTSRDEYKVMDNVNGVTYWFQSWQDVETYIFTKISWNCYVTLGKKVTSSEPLFAL